MKTTRTKRAPAPAFHYYGSTAYDWITGPSREFVLKRLASYYTGMLKEMKKKGRAGIECVVCRVDLPQEATYSIKNYVPHAITERNEAGELKRTDRRVPLRQYERLIITDTKGAAILNPELEQVTDAQLIKEQAQPITEAAWG